MKHLMPFRLLLFLATLCLWSCTPEEEGLDLRGQLCGAYSYTKTSYHNHGIFSETGTLHIVSDTADNEKLIIMEEETFYGAALNAIDSSLIFNIPEQNIIQEQDQLVTIMGINNVSIEGIHCAAGYSPQKNRLRLYYKVVFKEHPLLNYNVSLLAEKQ